MPRSPRLLPLLLKASVHLQRNSPAVGTPAQRNIIVPPVAGIGKPLACRKEVVAPSRTSGSNSPPQRTGSVLLPAHAPVPCPPSRCLSTAPQRGRTEVRTRIAVREDRRGNRRENTHRILRTVPSQHGNTCLQPNGADARPPSCDAPGQLEAGFQSANGKPQKKHPDSTTRSSIQQHEPTVSQSGRTCALELGRSQ